MSLLASLYRVSTPSQVKDDDEMPIPAQQNAAHGFCTTHGHTLVKEYFEPGVSAYRKSALSRGVVQEILKDAKDGLFTILLIFKTSRLSRRAAEYPWLIQELKQYGVIVWEIDRDKRLTPLTHEEKLITYIDGWQAEGESLNISAQSRAGKFAKAKTGGRTGGRGVYGLEIKSYETIIVNKRPKVNAIWGLNEYEAGNIMKMAEMIEKGHGTLYIAKIFNQNGIKNRSGSEWTKTSVLRIIKNPAIAGIYLYRKNNPERSKVHQYKDLFNPEFYVHKDIDDNYIINKELQIIPLERWLNLMEIMENRPKGGYINPNREKSHLLSGFLRCGYCGRNMNGVSAYLNHTKRDGTVARYDKSGYRCNSHITGRKCDGPHSIVIRKVEEPFHRELERFFKKFDAQKFINDTEDKHTVLLQLKNQLKNTERSIKKVELIKEHWLAEMDECFARNGEYMFSKENIANKIMEQDVKIRELQKGVAEIKRNIASQLSHEKNIKKLLKIIPDWYQRFLNEEVSIQNEMLKDIIANVIVYKDRLIVNYHLDVKALVDEIETDEFISMNKVISIFH